MTLHRALEPGPVLQALRKDNEKALERLRQLMARLPDPEKKAECVLTMGQAMEQVGDYPVAVRYYREAMALEPTRTFTWYVINNNLGFSQRFGSVLRGRTLLPKGHEIDRSLPNAHQNLGILVGRPRSIAGRSEMLHCGPLRPTPPCQGVSAA